MYSRPDASLMIAPRPSTQICALGVRGRVMQRMQEVRLIDLYSFINDGHKIPFH